MAEEYNISGMTEDEKEGIVQQAEMSMDYGEKIQENERKLYESIMNERKAGITALNYYTTNLEGRDFKAKEGERVIYKDFKSALNAYLNAGWVNFKSIGYTAPNDEHVRLAIFETLEAKNIINENRHSILSPLDKIADKADRDKEAEYLLDNVQILSNELNTDNAKCNLVTEYEALAKFATEKIIHQNSDEGLTLQGRIANKHRPQDYLEINIEGNKEHEIVFTANIIHANEFEESITFTGKIDTDNPEKSVSQACEAASIDLKNRLEDVFSKLDTDIEYPFVLYSDFREDSESFQPFETDSLESHKDRLNDLGYESEPSYESYNLNKDGGFSINIDKNYEKVSENIETNMGKMPLEDYLEIKAYQYGFDSYEELKEAGLSISIDKSNEKEQKKEATDIHKRKFLQGNSR